MEIFYSNLDFLLQAKHLTIFLILIVISILLKFLFSTRKVNCWFCNTDTTVKFSDRNSWTCKNCDQYNGFDKNGDYNKEISAMYDHDLNKKEFSAAKGKSNKIFSNTSQLCDICSRNQLLKVKQISKFEPMVESNFNEEFESFVKKLDEDLYALCKSCKKNVSKHVKTQDTILKGCSKSYMIQQKANMLQNRKTASNTCNSQSNFCENITSYLFYISIMNVILSVLDYILLVNKFSSLLWTEQISQFLLYFGVILSLLLIIKATTISKWHYFAFFIWSSTACFSVCNQFYMSFNLIDLSNLGSLKEMISDHKFLSYFVVSTPFFHFIKLLTPKILLVLSSFNAYAQTKKVKQDQINSNLIGQGTRYNKIDDIPTNRFSDDEDDDDVTYSSRKKLLSSAGLNGSLNALNINDEEGDRNTLFKHPLSRSNENILGSLNYTPPPSRSSSVLSLDIQSGGSKYFSLAPKTIYSNDKMSNRLGNLSKVSCQRPSQSHLNSTEGSLYYSVSNKTFSQSKSLITPAKLKIRNMVHPKKSDAHKAFINPVAPSYISRGGWERKIEGDVTINDSVSQAGCRTRHDLGENYENRTVNRSPFIPKPSSPAKSIISSITSFTSNSVRKVEESRFCRWIMIILVVLNFVLVLLLAVDVRKIRDLESLNTRTL